MHAGVKRNTKRTGDLSELRLMHDLVRAGYLVSIPFGEDHRYDLVIEKNGVFSRVQVKTGRLRKGVVLFNCYSSHTHRGGAACRRYTNEIDYFGVYCPELDATYLVPIADVPVTKGVLNRQWTGAKAALGQAVPACGEPCGREKAFRRRSALGP